MKFINRQTINHVWDGSQHIVADIVENQFYEASYYIRGTNLVSKYNFFNGAKSEYTYYTQNAHGDVVNLTNADGNVTKTYTYDACIVALRMPSKLSVMQKLISPFIITPLLHHSTSSAVLPYR